MISVKRLLSFKSNQTPTPKFKIFCDMDGVIADFESQFKTLTGMVSHDFEEKYSTNEFWNVIHKEGSKFWSLIPKTPQMDELWNYIKPHKPSLLSAPSTQLSSRVGKQEWVNTHIPNTELIMVPAKEKKNYAAPNHILIDDMEKNIKEWKEAGGIGILHESTDQTIKELTNLGL